jgi:hypothetical protein
VNSKQDQSGTSLEVVGETIVEKLSIFAANAKQSQIEIESLTLENKKMYEQLKDAERRLS